MEIWKSQNRGFPHSHRLGGYDEQTGKNPKNRTQSVKHVPGLKCKTCPRLDPVAPNSTRSAQGLTFRYCEFVAEVSTSARSERFLPLT